MSSASRPADPRSAAPPRRAASLPGDLVGLAREPARAFPRLFTRPERRGALGLLGFPAVSGVFVAYVIAKGVGLGDHIGFAAASAAVVAAGAVLGIVALWFAGTLPSWYAQSSGAREDPSIDRMYLVFSYATWPFLPLLLVLVTAEVLLYGDLLFSRQRPAAPAAVVWLLRGLQLATILLWLGIMVKGTAVARRESDRRAAGELLRWGLELVAIGVLFVLILIVSLMFW
jgi:hypothetical protein